VAEAGKAAGPRRVYNYLLASLSLAALASGLVFLFALVISVSVQEARDYIVEDEGWQGQLAIVLTLLAVGGSTWAYYWSRAQMSLKESPEERNALSRRVYIYSVFGVGALATLGSLSAALYLVLQAALDNELGVSVLRDAQWAIGVLLTTGVITGYFWFVIQEDRRALSEAAPAALAAPVARKDVTFLAPAGGADLARRLEARLGYGVTLWTGLDEVGLPALTEEQLGDAAARIQGSPLDRVLVTVEGAGLRVSPFHEA
jgi:uncharacterized BrkB/YihY/UPF0761 family membrane protein